MFVFCCYTGFGYQEMSSLEKKHIIKGFDGNLWVEMIRQKTDKKISIPLLPKASLYILILNLSFILSDLYV
jgi:integrase/recombinase XerD